MRNNDLRKWSVGDRVVLPACGCRGVVSTATDAFGRTGVRYNDNPGREEWCQAASLVAEYEVQA